MKTSSEDMQDGQLTYFRPRALRNLKEIDRLDSLSPILDFKVYCAFLGYCLIFLLGT